jgi:hypothetical protein
MVVGSIADGYIPSLFGVMTFSAATATFYECRISLKLLGKLLDLPLYCR